MTTDQGVRRRGGRSNHDRILEAAREELGRNPDASLDDIAKAAGVVRRTIYGHFPNRKALIGALAAEAQQALIAALGSARRDDAPPVEGLARMVLASAGVGDRYRMLISLGRRDLGEQAVRETLTPARAMATALIERGQADGSMSRHLSAPMLALATEAVALTLLDTAAVAQIAQLDQNLGEAAAVAVLVAAGVEPSTAQETVRAATAS